MNNFLDLCVKRQSCRTFSDKTVEREKLLSCVEAARLAPSACNSQPWKFIVVNTPEIVAEVAKTTMQLGINNYMASATAFIVVLEEHAVLMPKIRPIFDSQYFAKGDIGGVLVTLCYAAEAQGLGSCIIGMYDREKLCSLLNLPSETRFGQLVALGYPADDKVRNKSRKPLEDLVRFV